MTFSSTQGREGRPALMAVGLAVALLTAGCADTAGIASHARMRDAAQAGVPATAQPANDFAQVDAQWWHAFGDAQLDTLEQQALAASPSLQVAQARVAKALAATGVAEAAGRPQLSGDAQVLRQRYSENYIYGALGGTVQENGTLQLNGSWELDFFGRNRAAIQAAVGSARAAQADAQAARILLTTNVARSYIQWARLEAQRDVARRTLAQREETLRLVRDRVSAGLDTQLEQRQSEGGLPEARQQIEVLNEQIENARHALDALVAVPDATRGLAPPALASLRAVPLATQIPADLLARRPDVAAARWRVEAAARDEEGARAQFYPNINLTAFVGTQSIGFDKLVKSGSLQWGVGPALHLPIFEGGRLRANLGGKAADHDAAIESYNGAVIDAVHEVADQVASARSIGRQQVEQGNAQRAAEDAYHIALQRYQAGLGTYLNVLTAETAVLTQRRQAVDLAARALDTQASLARALGGGWASDAPAAAQKAALNESAAAR
ncbi:MAG: efflux transporter outer membrane subunit [Pseudacidovorax sp.]|nr:efflux transporter outer membrane subunit [Pseudacidovorax sp.]